ncbi:MAG: hypothetical protein V8R28_16535 [Bacteroides cellulosilyticus]|jgi:hypothetical protein|uniref:hypothetical protein n=1 Tax=uncultured Bacteroides sp. TaxID=162156 RepID=UPI0025921320|nr:hypothetical protein [uncultured Bacteroides sp.]
MILLKINIWKLALYHIMPWVILMVTTLIAWIFGILHPSYYIYIAAVFIAYYLGFKPLNYVLDMWNYDRWSIIIMDDSEKEIIYKPYKDLSIEYKFHYEDIATFQKYKNGYSLYQQLYFYRIVLKNGEEYYFSSLLVGKLEKVIDTVPCTYMKNSSFIYVLGYI